MVLFMLGDDDMVAVVYDTVASTTRMLRMLSSSGAIQNTLSS